MIIKGNSVGFPLPDPRKGMAMQGNINMNGNSLSGIKTPETADEAANKGYVDSEIAAAKKYADDKHFELTVTVPATAWYKASDKVYQCNVSVPNLLITDLVDIDVFMADHSTEALEHNMVLEEEFSKIFHAPYGTGALFLRARELPTVDLPVKLKVVR